MDSGPSCYSATSGALLSYCEVATARARDHGGFLFAFPTRVAEGLRDASARELADVRLTPGRLGLHWERLDVDLEISGLLAGVFGTRRWMRELGRLGGAEGQEDGRSSSWRRGMYTGARATDVRIEAEGFELLLEDGRRLWVPYSWSPLLAHATDAERSRWRLIGGGVGIHWPDIDEDLSVEGLLRGGVSRAAQRSG